MIAPVTTILRLQICSSLAGLSIDPAEDMIGDLLVTENRISPKPGTGYSTPIAGEFDTQLRNLSISAAEMCAASIWPIW